LATKKGIIVTIIILAAITGASFLVWLIPHNSETKLVITDFGSHLDNVKEIHSTIQIEIDKEFQNLLNGEITPKEYIEIAEISSFQITSQIMTLVESKAPSEWYESYLNYIESLKKFNLQIRETMVVATLMDEDKDSSEIQEILEKIDLLKTDSKTLAVASDEARP
jgi:CRISPR/Cas system-associated exonuclease Cas4 (RecB family)